MQSSQVRSTGFGYEIAQRFNLMGTPKVMGSASSSIEIQVQLLTFEINVGKVAHRPGPKFCAGSARSQHIYARTGKCRFSRMFGRATKLIWLDSFTWCVKDHVV